MTPIAAPEDCITLAHGAGGRASSELIDAVMIEAFGAPAGALEDQARLPLSEVAARGDRLAFTTDSYVLDPLFIPGADIGKLAVAGTVNDLAVGAALPLMLSCALIIEEGLPLASLRRVVQSMAETARAAGVPITTGDTKVVPRGAADKLFINTSGLGAIRAGLDPRVGRIAPGDVVLINGPLGDHGAAVVEARGELALNSAVRSDCAALHGLIAALIDSGAAVRAMRDITRGGLATVLNELAAGAAEGAGLGIRLDESAVPVRENVRGICELLGLDPLYLANEGKLAAVVAAEHAETALAALRAHPLGSEAAAVATVTASPAGRVLLATRFGGERLLDRLVGDQLPRIC